MAWPRWHHCKIQLAGLSLFSRFMQILKHKSDHKHSIGYLLASYSACLRVSLPPSCHMSHFPAIWPLIASLMFQLETSTDSRSWRHCLCQSILSARWLYQGHLLELHYWHCWFGIHWHIGAHATESRNQSDHKYHKLDLQRRHSPYRIVRFLMS